MSIPFLKGNRSRFRNLLAKELAKGRGLLQDVDHEASVHMRDVNNCIKRLNEFITKLEEANEKLSMAIDGRDGAEEIKELIREDWDYISTVMDCRHELVDIKVSEQRSPTDNSSSVTVTEDKFDQVIQMTTQMQQVIHGQQQLQQQQQQQQISIGQLTTSKSASVRLPILEIPSFSGNNLKWTEFWDTFKASVHKNTSISDIEKLNYLLSKLSGKTNHSVSGILLSNENYSVATDLLKERHGDSQTVINTHYVDLNLRSAQNTLRGLRSLYDQIEKHLRSLKALEQDINQDVFISMITSKLPKEVLIQLEIQKGTCNKWTVKALREFFKNYVAARERAEQQFCTAKA